MKLTKYMREAFVRAALLDVPQVDHAELIRNEHRKLIMANLPKLVLTVLKDDVAARYIKHRDFAADGVSLGSFPSTTDGPRYRSLGSNDWHPAIPQADQARLDAMILAKKATDAEIERLKKMLEGVANSATTRKALAEALPEFEKYLPADRPAATRALPALANVVSEFSKAGWPKGKR